MLKPIGSSGRRMPYIDEREPASPWTTAMTLLIFLLIVGAGLCWLNFALGLWQTALKADRPPDTHHPVRIAIAGTQLSIPANMIRQPFVGEGRSDLGSVQRLDLAVFWPQLAGFVAAREAELADPSARAPIIHIALVEHADPVSPRDRFRRVYLPNLEGRDIGGPDGLIGRKLAAGSGYGGETLFFEPYDRVGAGRPDAPRYLIRCSAAADELAPATCFHARPIGARLRLEYRFRSGLLGDWRRIDDAVLRLLRDFGLPAVPAVGRPVQASASRS